MKRKNRILNLIEKNFTDFIVNIEDNSYKHAGHSKFDGKGETHIKILLEPKNLKNINRLEIHRKIYELLEYELDQGLHSIEIKLVNFRNFNS